MTTDRRRHTFPAAHGLHSATALASRPRAVVVGGGIAGLAAATGLAERGGTLWADCRTGARLLSLPWAAHKHWILVSVAVVLRRRCRLLLTTAMPAESYPRYSSLRSPSISMGTTLRPATAPTIPHMVFSARFRK